MERMPKTKATHNIYSPYRVLLPWGIRCVPRVRPLNIAEKLHEVWHDVHTRERDSHESSLTVRSAVITFT